MMINRRLGTEKLKHFLSILTDRLKKSCITLKLVFYGFSVHELQLELMKEKGHMNNLLMLMIFGDIAGLPLFPSYFSMRILPYIVPLLDTWKRNLFREKDITDILSTDF